jgi:hypothetical protein
MRAGVRFLKRTTIVPANELLTSEGKEEWTRRACDYLNKRISIMIKPTVGRMVYFRPSIHTHRESFAMPPGNEPCAATIARVWNDRVVNLSVLDANGVQHPITSVPLIQEGEPKPEDGLFCYWMPFQIGQALKTASHAEMEEHLRKVEASKVSNTEDEKISDKE